MKTLLAIVGVLASATAHAECPAQPDDAVCRPWSGVLLPTVYGAMYAPHGLSDTYVGGGVEAVLLAWSDNTPAYGPSQGRIRFDIGVLDSTGNMPNLGRMVMWRIGAQLAFERNASRAWGIPFFAADLGGLWTESTGRRYDVDAGVGVYLVHRRGVIVDVELGGILPFSNPDLLGGFTGRIGASFALW